MTAALIVKTTIIFAVCAVAAVIIVAAAAKKRLLRIHTIGEFIIIVAENAALTWMLNRVIAHLTGTLLTPTARAYPLIVILSTILLTWMLICIDQEKRAQNPKDYFKRCKHYVPAVFAIVFTTYIWGPIDIFLYNTKEYQCTLFDFVFLLIANGLIATILFSCILALLFRGKIAQLGIPLVAAVGLCLYLQGVYFNGSMNGFDGTTLDMGSYAVRGILNGMIWVLIIMAVIVVALKFQIVRETVWAIVPGWIIAVQLVAGVISFAQAEEQVFSKELILKERFVLSTEECMTVSSDENIIVFILDFFSNQYIPRMLEEYPDGLDCMQDFTFYTNADTLYFGTSPSISHLVTGQELDTTLGVCEWEEQIWRAEETKRFYRLLKENGWNTYLFSRSTALKNVEQAKEMIENGAEVKPDSYTVNTYGLCSELVRASLYRYAPEILKPVFWLAGTAETITFSYDPNLYDPELEKNYGFLDKLRSKGLAITDQEKRYLFYHLYGTHGPWDTNERGEYAPDTTLEQTARGSFAVIEEYITQLKALGVYDKSTIIVTSDHGDALIDMQPILFVKRPGEHREAMEYSAAPVSEMDYPATILASAGVEKYGEFGRAYFDISQDEVRERSYWVRQTDDNYPKVPYRGQRSKYAVRNVYYVYDYIGDYNDLAAAIEEGPSRIVPMVDSFY